MKKPFGKIQPTKKVSVPTKTITPGTKTMEQKRRIRNSRTK